MNKLQLYIVFIFIIKILFIVTVIYSLYVKHKKPTNKILLKRIEFWKDHIEFIFNMMMSLLLVILFNPHTHEVIKISGEVKLLLYLFGIIMFMTADWKIFIHESPTFEFIQKVLSNH